MVVVDTNVLAYLFLDGPFTEDARRLFSADADWRSDRYVLVELTNVLRMTMRARELPLAEALAILHQSRGVIEQGLMDVAHDEVLRTSETAGVTAYDARFLVAAQELGVRLVTEDARLRRAAPALTQSLAAALAC